ncbi:DUF4123 domain-containing protein [Photobacterium halotolerans]|uniref:DUF4123 domain-containing protein n=1 Tax=Photobacterium halotolerans TaxID=265726 RepID=A0A7X4WTR4_9GAMM|nr:DUF4123 domain-containing protein [Photobacterium halotolerans]NAW63644.1 DUF4123 domain-containing protein [Photobacterium halotolerans]NAW88678.1 DUF4123 domain-containing protein [Photobacterium halotolerans]
MSIAPLKPEWQIQQATPMLPASDQNAYMLFEPLLWPDWQTQLSRALDSLDAQKLFLQTRFAQLENSPMLVSLRRSEPAMQLCREAMVAAPCGCFLIAPDTVATSDLLQTLRQRIIVDKGNVEAIFRFYDPRALVPLLGSIRDNQRYQFFPLLSQIQWFDKNWLSAPIIKSSSSTSEVERWALSEPQRNTMQTILQQWSRNQPS